MVWQASYGLAVNIYKITKSFPKKEQHGLTNQLRHAAVSVSSNIAEGFDRNNHKEKDQFYKIANESLTEVESQLLIVNGVGYINAETYS